MPRPGDARGGASVGGGDARVRPEGVPCTGHGQLHKVAHSVTFCDEVRYLSMSVHAPRRPQHTMTSGAGSSGAAVLVPMITSDMADIEEQAVLGSAS